MKKIFGAAVAVSMLAAGSANAAIQNGYSQFYGDESEIVVALWDSVAKRSVLVDTGFNLKDIVAGQSHTTDISAALTAAFGSNLSNVRWNAAGYSNQSFNPDFSENFVNNGGLFTGPDGVSYEPIPGDIPAYQAGFNELLARTGDSLEGDVYFSDPVGYETMRDINNYYVALTDTDVMYLDNELWGNNARYLPWNASMVGSGDMQAYWNHFNAEGTGVMRDNLGRFTLDLAEGTFSYAVPVPAAAWLLISGLAGLGTVARRRKQA